MFVRLASFFLVTGLFACGGQAVTARDAGPDVVGDNEPIESSPPESSVPESSTPESSTPEQDGGSCVLDTSSTLPHVHIVFHVPSCDFTLAQAAAKISIDYDLVVDQDVPGFVPAAPYWYGSSAANLVLNEVVSGGGQSYCLCDQGLPYPQCPTDDGGLSYPDGGPSGACPAITIPTGTYHRVFTWDGRNWMGPSDTSNPEGPPFPAGDYQLVVSTSPGSIGDAGALSATGKLRIRLH
jgi:hypothetical protein